MGRVKVGLPLSSHSKEEGCGWLADVKTDHADARTKEQYLQEATTLLNQLGRYDVQHPAYLMGRAVYAALKASVTSIKTERVSNMDMANRAFDDALKQTGGKNMFAVLGKARWWYSKGRYEKALECYQEVLKKKPDMIPDPRIGIGLCFWMLNFKEDAKMAWERSLELVGPSIILRENSC